MNLEQNIKGLCSKHGIHFQDFLGDFEIDSVHELSLFDLEAICDEYDISLESLLFKSLIIESELQKKLEHIKLLILDVDGVMTDGGMSFTANGDEQKKFNTKDGMGIMKAMKNGLQIGIISSGFSDKIVKTRANMLGIDKCHVGREPKMDILKNWMDQDTLSFEEIAMIGDDINDFDIMNKIGVSACPADAVIEIKSISNIILQKKGGDGCIREFLDQYWTR